MLDYAKAQSHVARIADLGHQMLALTEERAGISDEITRIHSDCTLRLIAPGMTDAEITARVWQELRAGDEYPELLRRDREAKSKYEQANIEAESLRLEILLAVSFWSETVLPMDALLSRFKFSNIT